MAPLNKEGGCPRQLSLQTQWYVNFNTIFVWGCCWCGSEYVQTIGVILFNSSALVLFNRQQRLVDEFFVNCIPDSEESWNNKFVKLSIWHGPLAWVKATSSKAKHVKGDSINPIHHRNGNHRVLVWPDLLTIKTKFTIHKKHAPQKYWLTAK